MVLLVINHCKLFNAKSSLCIYIKYKGIWFGWVFWHIYHCRLFNAKSSLYIYIEYIGFGWFYGISTIAFIGFYCSSTIVRYLMPNPLYTNILNIYIYMICKLILLLILSDEWAQSAGAIECASISVEG